MDNNDIVSWLLDGDVSVQYQTWRDLLDIEKPALRKKIAHQGWGLYLLQHRKEGGHWGKGFYQPKWTSTHYTLLDLKNLNIAPDNKAIRETLQKIFESEKGSDGGIAPFGARKRCDVCVNGMVLNYSAYFKVESRLLASVIDFLLSQRMPDGGFNCRSNTIGATHSSLHTTLSVLEGISEYERHGYEYRIKELSKARDDSHEFILMHRLFRSDKTGKVISPAFLRFHFPARWYYDILRAMDYFQSVKMKYDSRLDDAIEVILRKRTSDGFWKLASKHPGQTYFDMEQAGKPSRWNTLRAIRVLRHFNIHVPY